MYLLTILFLIIGELHGSDERQLIQRGFTHDEFYEPSHTKCVTGSSASVVKQTEDRCRCSDKMTYYPVENRNCFSKGEITSFADSCSEGFVTMEGGQSEVLNSCKMNRVISMEVWDLTETMTVEWRYDLSTSLLQHVEMTEGKPGITENTRDGCILNKAVDCCSIAGIKMDDVDWSGMFIRMKYTCTDDEIQQPKCMLIKFKGEIYHPLSMADMKSKIPNLLLTPSTITHPTANPNARNKQTTPTTSPLSTPTSNSRSTSGTTDGSKGHVTTNKFDNTSPTTTHKSNGLGTASTTDSSSDNNQRNGDWKRSSEHHTKGMATTIILTTTCLMVAIVTLIALIMIHRTCVKRKNRTKTVKHVQETCVSTPRCSSGENLLDLSQSPRSDVQIV